MVCFTPVHVQLRQQKCEIDSEKRLNLLLFLAHYVLTGVHFPFDAHDSDAFSASTNGTGVDE